MPKITQEFLKSGAVSPEEGQIIYRDEDLPGFALRVTPKSKSFIVEKRVNGQNRRVTIGNCEKFTVESAKKEAVKILGAMAQGIDPVTGRRGPVSEITLREVMEKYLLVRRIRPMTKTVYRRQLTHGLADWLDLPVTSITKDMIQMRHQKLSSGTKWGTSGNATANNTMKTLKSMLNFASDHFSNEDEPLIKVNPVSRLSRDRAWHVIPIRQGIVPDNKLSAWYSAVVALENTTARDYYLFLLTTGCRRTETSLLTWQHIDFSEKIIRIPGEITKNHYDHNQPMSDFIFALLQERHNMRHSQYVFPGRGLGPLSGFVCAQQEIRQKSGCAFTVHDLRRTLLTMAEKLEVPHGVIKKLANHVSRANTTHNYIVQDPERTRFYVNKIVNELVALMGANMAELHFRRVETKGQHQQLQLPLSLKGE
jgi:integrase